MKLRWERTLLTPFGVATALLTLLAASVHACNVPVFRFALERWQADPYEVVVFHKGPLADKDRAIIDDLEKRTRGAASANFQLQMVDLDAGPTAALQELFESQKDATLPWMVVRFPSIARIQEPIWAGRLNADIVKPLLDSPARRELSRRILNGESAAWIFLASGNKEKDEAARRVLDATIAAMEKTLKLPERTNKPDDRISNEVQVPLRIAFSVVTVSRDDPAERWLVRQLLLSEPDLLASAEPMAFPVFGRGRLLYVVLGKGIRTDNIEEACRYVVAACTCEVKRQHPGVDLLMTADWDSLIEGRVVPQETTPELAGLSEFLPTPVADNDEKPAPIRGMCGTPRPTDPLVINLAMAVVAAGLILGLIASFHKQRSRRNTT
jgi:hypothetical protein